MILSFSSYLVVTFEKHLIRKYSFSKVNQLSCYFWKIVRPAEGTFQKLTIRLLKKIS